MLGARSGRAIIACLVMLFGLPPPAFAHPMGNFSINHYSKIVPQAAAIELDYIIDMAEIPTFQEIQQSKIVARVGDPSLGPYLTGESEHLKNGLTLELDGRPLPLETVSRQIIFPPGAGGLATMKMGFVYRAAVPNDGKAISLAAIHYRDHNFPERAGWKEVVASSGPGATLVESSVPAHDRSLELTNYPTDMLHSPPQTLDADMTIKLAPRGNLARDDSRREHASAGWLEAGPIANGRGLALEANSQGTPHNAFTELINSKRGDTLFLLMAALIAAVLGGFHALEPGHGKTLVAAYLVGSRGKARHAILLGTIVTAAHTVSVYALGIITLYASQWIVPEQLYPWLGMASGLMVAGIGFALFIRRYLSNEPQTDAGHMHDGSGDHDRHVPDVRSPLTHRHTWWGGHIHEHEAHSHDDSHRHGDGETHAHHQSQVLEPIDSVAPASISLKSLLVLGITGGIVPCPAALVVLLGALAIHRVAFGLFLIVAFSFGLAAVLIGFGLAIVYAGQFMNRLGSRGPLTERWLPLASSAVITIVGVTLTLQSLASAGVLRAG